MFYRLVDRLQDKDIYEMAVNLSVHGKTESTRKCGNDIISYCVRNAKPEQVRYSFSMKQIRRTANEFIQDYFKEVQSSPETELDTPEQTRMREVFAKMEKR
jgi:hypothetical protein